METESTFEINLPLFKGPFDLLLFFIERDELDIHDIPISQVTDEFLQYIQHLEQLNIEVASEFILVAGTLMRIKAKTLLPRPQLDDAGNEIDPRQELVQHLLEYKRYKSVLQELAALEERRQAQYSRGNSAEELQGMAKKLGTELEVQNLDLYKLLKVYQKVMERMEERQARPVHTVEQFPYQIGAVKTYLEERLKQSGSVALQDLVAENPQKVYFIFLFLSILELLQNQVLSATVGEGYNNLWLNYRQPEERNRPNQEQD